MSGSNLIHETLLRGLEPGQVMWLAAAGNSLWPLFRDGDSLKVERTAELRVGDIAVVKRPDGILAAHVVVAVEPLITASTAGLEDPQPLEGLARVIGYRRRGREHDWHRRIGLGAVPALARIVKRVPLARTLVRLMRDQRRRS